MYRENSHRGERGVGVRCHGDEMQLEPSLNDWRKADPNYQKVALKPFVGRLNALIPYFSFVRRFKAYHPYSFHQANESSIERKRPRGTQADSNPGHSSHAVDAGEGLDARANPDQITSAPNPPPPTRLAIFSSAKIVYAACTQLSRDFKDKSPDSPTTLDDGAHYQHVLVRLGLCTVIPTEMSYIIEVNKCFQHRCHNSNDRCRTPLSKEATRKGEGRGQSCRGYTRTLNGGQKTISLSGTHVRISRHFT